MSVLDFGHTFNTSLRKAGVAESDESDDFVGIEKGLAFSANPLILYGDGGRNTHMSETTSKPEKRQIICFSLNRKAGPAHVF